MSDSRGGPIRKRLRGGRPVEWLLVGGHRVLVAGVLLVSVFASFLLLAVVGPGQIASNPEQTLVLAFLPPVMIGLVMGVTLVLTFNQLVISRELGPIGVQRKRMEESMNFRREVEDLTRAQTSPPDPASFLQCLVEMTAVQAEQLHEALGEEADPPSAVREYTTATATQARQVSVSLEGEQFGTFAFIRAALGFDYSWHIHRGKELRHEYADVLPVDLVDDLDELLDLLEFFGPAREHFKTLYFRWEIINLSRLLVYVSIPSLGVLAYAFLVLDPVTVAGTTLGIANGLLITIGAILFGLFPFAIFLAYILRIVTVTQRTLAIGPFILRD